MKRSRQRHTNTPLLVRNYALQMNLGVFVNRQKKERVKYCLRFGHIIRAPDSPDNPTQTCQPFVAGRLEWGAARSTGCSRMATKPKIAQFSLSDLPAERVGCLPRCSKPHNGFRDDHKRSPIPFTSESWVFIHQREPMAIDLDWRNYHWVQLTSW